MNKLKIFNNEEFGQIRTAEINNEPYFMLVDVCRVLDIKNTRDAKTRLNPKGVGTTDVLTSGGKQQADFINESNLYKLVFQSRKPQAEKFSEWVTSEVLPAIRKHGLYATEELLNNPDFLIQAGMKLKEERELRMMAEMKAEKLEIESIQKDGIIEDLNEKVKYLDVVLRNSNLFTVTQIAKDYGMSAKEFNKLLQEKKVQFLVNGQWVLYSKYQDKGYSAMYMKNVSNRTGFDKYVQTSRWTAKGVKFLYEFLKKDGLIPLIER